MTPFRDLIQAKWVIFEGGLTFFIVCLMLQDDWSASHTLVVWTVASTAALMAVTLDRVE